MTYNPYDSVREARRILKMGQIIDEMGNQAGADAPSGNAGGELAAPAATPAPTETTTSAPPAPRPSDGLSISGAGDEDEELDPHAMAMARLRSRISLIEAETARVNAENATLRETISRQSGVIMGLKHVEKLLNTTPASDCSLPHKRAV